MTEEVKVEDQVVVPEPEAKEAPQLSDIEVKARDMGWRPRDEFDGSDDDFIDAKEFVRRKPLFDKIEHQSKEIRQIKQAFDALQTHYTKVNESAMKKAISQLEAQRAQAVEDGNGVAFRQADEALKEANQAVQELDRVRAQPAPTEAPQEFVDWTNKNRWYRKDEAMTVFADAYGIRLRSQGKSPTEVLEAVERKVKEEFPHKFRNPNKDNAPSVDTSRPSGRTPKAEMELTEEERQVMHRLTSAKGSKITKEQYLKDLAEIKKNS